MTIRGKVVFSILMQNNGGIISQSPSYIQEKFDSCSLCVPEVLLDSPNTYKFNAYKERWNFNWDKDRDLCIPIGKFNKVTGEPKEKK
jgi:hypothetical protein